MKRKMGDTSEVPIAPSHADARDLVPTRISQIDAGDSQSVKQRDVKVVRLRGDEAGNFRDDDGGAIAQRRRINVIEARAGIP